MSDPKVSVIVPVYNGAAIIQRCLDAVASQQLAPDHFELIVVDDGSKDQTAEVVQSWFVAHPQIRGRYVHQTNAGPAAARNHGAQVASAPLLLFTDGDCAPTEGWIEALSAPFDDESVMGDKGTYRTKQKK